MTPFEVVYGRPPPSYIAYIPSTSTVAAVDLSLKDRDAMIRRGGHGLGLMSTETKP